MGTFLHGLPQHLQLLGRGAVPLSVMDRLPWWVSLLRQEILTTLLFSEQQKETFLSLVNHNRSLLSWSKRDLQSIDSDHWGYI